MSIENRRSIVNRFNTFTQTRLLIIDIVLSFSRSASRNSRNDFISLNLFALLFIPTLLLKKYLYKTSHHPVYEQAITEHIHHPRCQ